MKLLVTAPLWKRPNLARRCAVSWISAFSGHSDVDVSLLLAGSEGDASRSIAEDVGAHYIETPNEPLSAKFNALMQASSALEWDWLVQMGDDDLVNEPWGEAMVASMRAADCMRVGWDDCYFYDGRLWYWPGYEAAGGARDESIGAGRALRRRVVEAIGYVHCTNAGGSDLDAQMTLRIRKRAPWATEHRLVMGGTEALMVDIKTEHSVSVMDGYRGECGDVTEEFPQWAQWCEQTLRAA